MPERCPECGSSYIKYFGIGTQQVEEAVNRYFPEAVSARLDIDAIKSRKDMDKILDDFSDGKPTYLWAHSLLPKDLTLIMSALSA